MKFIATALAFALSFGAFANTFSSQVTKKYCDDNMHKAVTNSEAITRTLVPPLVYGQVPTAVTNFMKCAGIPTHVTNTVTIEYFNTNYITTVTNQYTIDNRFTDRIVGTNSHATLEIDAVERLYKQKKLQITIFTQTVTVAKFNLDNSTFFTNLINYTEDKTQYYPRRDRYTFEQFSGSDNFYYLCQDRTIPEVATMRIRVRVFPDMCINGNNIYECRLGLQVVDGWIYATPSGTTNYVTGSTFPALGEYLWYGYSATQVNKNIMTWDSIGTSITWNNWYFHSMSTSDKTIAELRKSDSTLFPESTVYWNKGTERYWFPVTNEVVSVEQLTTFEDAFNILNKAKSSTVTAGETTTLQPGEYASVTNVGTITNAVFNFMIPKGEKGDKGDKGAATIQVGTVTTGEAGTQALITNSGTAEDMILDFTIPRGSVGDQGRAATIQVGTVTTGDVTSVINSGTSTNAVFDFVLVPGGKPSISVGNTFIADTHPIVTNRGTSANAIFDFYLPAWGTATVGRVETLLPNYNAYVRNSGHGVNAVFDFGIPMGLQTPVNVGRTYVNSNYEARVVNSGSHTNVILDFYLPSYGRVATISSGTTETLPPGYSAYVTNVGTKYDAVLNFGIPRGHSATVDAGQTINTWGDTDARVVNVGNTTNAIFDFYIPTKQYKLYCDQTGPYYLFSCVSRDNTAGDNIDYRFKIKVYITKYTQSSGTSAYPTYDYQFRVVEWISRRGGEFAYIKVQRLNPQYGNGPSTVIKVYYWWTQGAIRTLKNSACGRWEFSTTPSDPCWDVNYGFPDFDSTSDITYNGKATTLHLSKHWYISGDLGMYNDNDVMINRLADTNWVYSIFKKQSDLDTLEQSIKTWCNNRFQTK